MISIGITMIALGVLAAPCIAQYPNSVMINSQVPGSGGIILHDDGNYAALGTATDGYDPGIDVPEPAAPISNYVSTYFPHPTWSTPFGYNFMIDVRNAADNLTNAVKAYVFEVKTDRTGQILSLGLTIGASFPSSYGIVLFDSSASSYQNVRENAAYSYTVASSSPKIFVLRLGDATAPAISITFPTANVTLLSGNSYNLTWTLSDVSPIRYTKVSYSLNGGTTWTQIDSVGGALTSRSWTPPNTFTTQAKLKVEAKDWAGNLGVQITPYTFNIAPGSMTTAFSAGWNMISVPLIPVDSTTAAVFGDDITGPFFVYNYTPTTGYGLVQWVNHGRGYWLALANSASSVDVFGTPAVDSVNLSLSLGWNIVGAAMTAPVALTSLKFKSGSTLYTYSQAVTASWISSAFYKFNNGTGSYITATSLEPWGGYWLQTLIAGLQMITYPPPPGADEDAPGQPPSVDDENDWFIPITITQGNIEDHIAGLGAHFEATPGYDIWYDLPQPPSPPSGEYAHITFYHPGWGAPSGPAFSQDIRAQFSPSQTVTWEGTIEASQPGQLTLSFDDIAQRLPPGYAATVQCGGQSYNLLETPCITLAYAAPQKLSVTVSSTATGVEKSNSPIPTTFALNGIHPNPFNPTTVISFDLPRSCSVLVTVYTTSGQQVAILAEGWFDPGSYERIFDASDLPSGIYLCRFQAGTFSAIGKMVLLK
jgi:hypothetical protein